MARAEPCLPAPVRYRVLWLRGCFGVPGLPRGRYTHPADVARRPSFASTGQNAQHAADGTALISSSPKHTALGPELREGLQLRFDGFEFGPQLGVEVWSRALGGEAVAQGG